MQFDAYLPLVYALKTCYAPTSLPLNWGQLWRSHDVGTKEWPQTPKFVAWCGMQGMLLGNGDCGEQPLCKSFKCYLHTEPEQLWTSVDCSDPHPSWSWNCTMNIKKLCYNMHLSANSTTCLQLLPVILVGRRLGRSLGDHHWPWTGSIHFLSSDLRRP